MADLEELAARRRAALMDKQQKRMRFTRALNRSPLACATRLSVPAQNLSSSEVAGLHWLIKLALLPTNGGRHSVEDGTQTCDGAGFAICPRSSRSTQSSRAGNVCAPEH